MYVSTELVRAHHDEKLRDAETRRLIKQAAAASHESARPRRRPRIARLAFRPFRPVSQG